MIKTVNKPPLTVFRKENEEKPKLHSEGQGEVDTHMSAPSRQCKAPVLHDPSRFLELSSANQP
jgi:hypothetical protein